MTAQLIRVPDGKRAHIGLIIGTDWRPICGQRATDWWWMPLRFAERLRPTSGVCRDCVTAAGAIHDLALEASQT